MQSSRREISALECPSAASSTIFARTTSRCARVYCPARRRSSTRSVSLNSISYLLATDPKIRQPRYDSFNNPGTYYRGRPLAVAQGHEDRSARGPPGDSCAHACAWAGELLPITSAASKAWDDHAEVRSAAFRDRLRSLGLGTSTNSSLAHRAGLSALMRSVRTSCVRCATFDVGPRASGPRSGAGRLVGAMTQNNAIERVFLASCLLLRGYGVRAW